MLAIDAKRASDRMPRRRPGRGGSIQSPHDYLSPWCVGMCVLSSLGGSRTSQGTSTQGARQAGRLGRNFDLKQIFGNTHDTIQRSGNTSHETRAKKRTTEVGGENAGKVCDTLVVNEEVRGFML